MSTSRISPDSTLCTYLIAFMPCYPAVLPCRVVQAIMDDNLRIVRQIGEKQAHNAYLRDCYTLLKATQDLTNKAVEDLHALYRSLDVEPGYRAHEIIMNFRKNVLGLIQKACESQAACEELCHLAVPFSARAVFEPIRGVLADANNADGEQPGPHDFR